MKSIWISARKFESDKKSQGFFGPKNKTKLQTYKIQTFDFNPRKKKTKKTLVQIVGKVSVLLRKMIELGAKR